MKLIVGLGNPGTKYQYTRHNAGFLALDFFLKDIETIHCQSTFGSQMCEVHFHATKTFFIKPQTYMNNSGKAVKEVCGFYKVNSETDLLVIHDEKDLSLGTIKTTTSSRSAGHNGVQNIIDELGTQNFHRIRIGVETRMSGDHTPTDHFLLHPFTPEELKIFQETVLPKTKELIDQFIKN